MRPIISRLWFCSIGICWVLVWLLPAPLWGAKQQHPAVEEIVHGADFVLTRQGDRFSLRAQQAALRDIVKTLGAILAIEVVVRIPQDTTVTLDVAGLPLIEILERLRTFANIIYLTETSQRARSPECLCCRATARSAAPHVRSVVPHHLHPQGHP